MTVTARREHTSGVVLLLPTSAAQISRAAADRATIFALHAGGIHSPMIVREDLLARVVVTGSQHRGLSGKLAWVIFLNPSAPTGGKVPVVPFALVDARCGKVLFTGTAPPAQQGSLL